MPDVLESEVFRHKPQIGGFRHGQGGAERA